MLDLNLLQTFCKVAELGSFTRAAADLKQPKSRVSRAIHRLETDLQIQLIQRTTRALHLTEAGSQLYNKSLPLLSRLKHEVHELSIARQAMRGTLRISAPEDFGLEVLSHVLPSFLEQHPELQFELIFSNTYVDLMAAKVDVAFRIGPLSEASLIQRKLGNIKIILVATPHCIALSGTPKSSQELQRFKLLDFQLENDNEGVFEEFFSPLNLRPDFKSNHFSLLRKIVLQHQGIACLPDFFVAQDLKAGRLQRVLPQWESPPYELHLLYPPTPQMPQKTRAFIDFVVPAIKARVEN